MTFSIVVSHEQRLPRKMIDAPPQEMFKAGLNGTWQHSPVECVPAYDRGFGTG